MIQSREPPPRLEDALFPVEERSIGYATRSDTSGDAQYAPTSKYRAIVDSQRGELFAIVARDYRLITNREAVARGKNCFREVFGPETERHMHLFSLRMPATRSFCHMDFVHQPPGEVKRPEWFPFMRITNSYNRTKPLRFDIGFCRGICENGVIFGARSIEFRFLHTRKDVGHTVVFEKSFGSIAELGAKFEAQLEALKKFPVRQEHVPVLVCRALAIDLGGKRWLKPERAEQLTDFVAHVRALDELYARDQGRNAYAAFNVITDVASRPKLGISPMATVDRLQRRASAWAEEFAQESQKSAFSFEQYLEPTHSQAQLLEAFTGGQT